MTRPEIIYEDEAIIVCHKPAGLATQTKSLRQQDLESFLKNHIRAPFIGVVHRLDQPVEGVMVFAKTREAAAKLSEQVKKRSFGKKYYALVKLPEAAWLTKEGTLNDMIMFMPRENISKIVPEGTKGAKRAVLDYKVLASEEGRALLDITLHTGRHHQIRAQLSNINAPIIGDSKYGGSEPGYIGGICLCSYHIQFEHPVSGVEMSYCITPNNEMLRAILDNVKKLS